MEWLKKHADTTVTIGAIISACFYLNNMIDNKIEPLKTSIAEVKQDIVIIKTVLIMKDLFPKELAKVEKKQVEENHG